MDAPKCKICGKRHYGPCVPRRGEVVPDRAQAAVDNVSASAPGSGPLSRPQGNPEPGNTEAGGAPKFDRNEYHRNYMREYMRKRRAAERAPKEAGDGGQ